MLASRRLVPPLHFRRVTPERMDDPALDPSLHRDALAGLRRLNTLGLAAGHLWPFFRRELARVRRPLRVLDVACGSGDVLKALVRRSRGRIRGLGLDLSSVAVLQANANAPPGVTFRRADVLDPGRPLPPCDIALCSLFLHHLSMDQAAFLLARMATAARRAVVVSDLERSTASWCLVWLGARLVTRSPIVHADSGTSVEAGWTPKELCRLARRSGLPEIHLHRAFPARLILVARKGDVSP